MTTSVPGPPASVLAAILRQDPNHPYDPATQARRATFSATNWPFLPSLTNDVIWMPQYALLDANLQATGYLSTQGLPGVVAASRYVGATTSGAPASGTFAVGDFAIDQSGKVWICVTAGTPGSWTAGSGATNVINGVTIAGTPTNGQVIMATSGTAAKWATHPVDWLNVVTEYGADPAGVADSTTAIQNALSAIPASGGVVYLPAGTYLVSAPLTVPAAVTLAGSSGNVLSLTDYGSIIKPSASWAQGGAAVAAVILLASGTAEQKIRQLMIDGTSLAVAADGISSQGASSVLLENVAIDNVTGNSVNQAVSSAAWRAFQVTAHRAGLSGFVLNGSDQSWLECIAQGCGQASGDANTAPGWSVATCSNSQFTGCRAENQTGIGSGFTYTASNSASTGVQFAGCSTNYNGGHGIEITSSGSTGSGPVVLSGCRFGGDGWNPYPSGTGSGSYAGIFITNAASVIQITGCMIVPNPANAGNAPQFGMSVTSDNTTRHSRITVSDSLLWGAAAALNNDGTCPVLLFGSGCVFATGTGASPSYAVPGTELIAAGVAAPVPVSTQDLLGAVSGALAVSLPRPAVTSNTISTSPGQGYFRQLVMPAGVTVTSLALRVGSTAKSGGTHGWYAFCDKNFVVKAASTDQTDASTTWGTINTDQALAVTTDGTTKYMTTYTGVYNMAWAIAESGGTMPTLCGGAAVATGIAGQLPLLFGTCAGTANTTPPAVGSTIATLAGIAGDNFYAYVT